jgi:hypothetical protein
LAEEYISTPKQGHQTVLAGFRAYWPVLKVELAGISRINSLFTLIKRRVFSSPTENTITNLLGGGDRETNCAPAYTARSAIMPIRPFLSGQAFGPEVIRDMSLVFENVCEAIGLKTTEEPATTIVAQKVIELAERGVRDVVTLYTMTLREFSFEEEAVAERPQPRGPRP